MRHFNLATTALASLSFCVLSACATTEKPAVATAAAAVPAVAVAPTIAKTTEADTRAVAKTTTEATTQSAKEDGSRKVCKRRLVPGSNLRKKVCATVDEWNALRENSRSATHAIKRKGATAGTGN